ncbi:hypothetical protein GCM10027445_66230 [Amycolatopsis endophytica]|uniref:Anti-sigma factor antagonist n=1 Tax=Amycolatopsis endophytica TaxID=860233 RepID=A0A853B4T9_9PSEU|nr:STAS domain-containing protein [Amycolatopsis endophytica]NYI89817.1 anti-sigma B factor antagonist [Amycolatopsis endophytica]
MSEEVFAVRHRVTPDAVVVTVTGGVDLCSAPALISELDQARGAARAPRPVVVDLSGVDFLGSAGLSVLVEAEQRCAEGGTPLRLVASSRVVLRALEAADLRQVFTVSESVDRALTQGEG